MLEDAQHKLEHTNLPMANAQLLAIASTAILASGDFPRPTDEWEAKTAATKTWTNWKAHYRAATQPICRQMLAAGTKNVGNANAVTNFGIAVP